MLRRIPPGLQGGHSLELVLGRLEDEEVVERGIGNVSCSRDQTDEEL